MATDMLHRRAAHDFAAIVLGRAGYREHFKRPTLYTEGTKAVVSLQKREPQRAVPKRLLEGIERLARKYSSQRGIVFGKEIQVEKGTHSIVFRALA